MYNENIKPRTKQTSEKKKTKNVEKTTPSPPQLIGRQCGHAPVPYPSLGSDPAHRVGLLSIRSLSSVVSAFAPVEEETVIGSTNGSAADINELLWHLELQKNLNTAN